MKASSSCIALIAHDHRKEALLRWAAIHQEALKAHRLVATGTTGRLIRDRLGLEVEALESGPLGGDLEVGARLSKGEIDLLVFFWDPLESQPHDPDIRALLRIAVVWNVPVACNASTADFLMRSRCLEEGYQREIPDFTAYRGRRTPSGA